MEFVAQGEWIATWPAAVGACACWSRCWWRSRRGASLPAAAQATFPGTNGKLAFGSARNGYPADNDLYTMANNGTAQTRITSLNLDELNPSWSPNGNKITFERNTGLRSDIWIANADGTSATQLTTHAANDTRPAFSGTGTKIVFASDRSRHGRRLRPLHDGFERREPGQHHEHPGHQRGDHPSWSPDGTAIAFSRDGDIYKFSPSGTNLDAADQRRVRGVRAGLVPGSDKITYRTGINAVDERLDDERERNRPRQHHQQRPRSSRNVPCGRPTAPRSRSFAGRSRMPRSTR